MSNKALSKNLLRQLILYGKIKTTERRAKTLQSLTDRIVNRAKVDSVASRRFLLSLLPPQLVEKMTKNIATVFKKRTGGFTRIIKLGKRLGDNAQMVLIEWVEEITEVKSETREKKTTEKKNLSGFKKVPPSRRWNLKKKTKVKAIKKEKKNDKTNKNK